MAAFHLGKTISLYGVLKGVHPMLPVCPEYYGRGVGGAWKSNDFPLGTMDLVHWMIRMARYMPFHERTTPEYVVQTEI